MTNFTLRLAPYRSPASIENMRFPRPPVTEQEFGERLIRYATESQHRHNDASRAVGTAPNRSNGDYGHTVERMRGGGGD